MHLNNLSHPHFFSNCKTLCGVISFDGTFRQINAEWEKTLGYDSSHLPNCSYLDLVHPENYALTETTLYQLSETTESVTFANRFLHYDSTYREILWQASRIAAESAFYVIGIEIPSTLSTLPADCTHLQQENLALHEIINQLDSNLQELQAFFELTLRAKQECWLDWDLTTNQVTYSPLWEPLLGYSHDDLSTQNIWYSHIHPSDYYKVIKEVKNCLEDPSALYANNHRLQHKDGSYRWVQSQGMVLRDSSGQATRFLVIFTDITSHKRTEEALIECKKYEQIFLAQPHAVLLIDNQGRIIDANPSALQLYGYIHQTSLKLSINDIFTTHFNFSDLDLGVPQASYHQKQDQTLFPVEMIMELINYQGKPHFVVVIRDITSEKQATQILTESETRYRLLFEAESDAIIVFDSNTLQIFDINPAATSLYGYSREEWLQLNMENILDNVSLSLIDLRLAGKRRFHHILLHWHKKQSGAVFPVEISTGSYPFKDHTLVCATVRDITARKQAETALQKAEAFANALIQAAPVFLLAFTPSGKISLCNEVLLQALGYSLEELVNQDYKNLFPQAERPLIAESMSALLSQREKSILLENCLLTKTEQQLLVEWHASAVIGNDEQIAYVLGVGIDMSQRKRIQGQLRLFKRIVEVSHEAISISNAQGQLVYANLAHAKLFKHALKDTRQYNHRDYCTPETLAIIDDEITASFQAGKSWEGILEVFDTEQRQFPVWGRFDVIRDDQGHILFSFGLMHDASEQQYLEAILRYEHHQYQTIFHTAPVAIVYKNKENRIIRVNRYFAEREGTTPEQLEGKILHELLPAYAEQDYTGDLAVINTGQANLGLVEHLPQGIFRVDKIPYRDNANNILGVIHFATDISSYIQTEQQLREVQQAIQTHEIRFRLIIEHLPMMILAVDLNNHIVLWNQQCEQVTGYSAAEVINNPQIWTQLYPDTIYRENLFRVAQYMSKNHPENNRWLWKLTCKSGDQKMVAWSLINQVDMPDLLTVGVGEEVMEFDQAQQRQRDKEAKFNSVLQEHATNLRLIIENLPVMVGALDERVNIVFWNRYCEQVTGYSAKEIVNNPHAWELLYPEPTTRQKVRQIWQQVIQSHRELHRFTMILTSKTGTKKKIMWSMLSDKIKIQGWAVWGVGIDMTVHQKVLHHYENRLKMLVQNLPLMVNVYDEHGQLRHWNLYCEKVTGYTAAQMLQSPHSLAQLYQSVQYQPNLATQICLNSIAVPYETEMTCQDGSVRIIAWSNYTEKFPIPGWKHWLIGEDITVTKKVHQLSPDTTHSILYTAFNYIDVAICITDEGAKFVYINRAFGRLHGTRSKDLMNRQFTLMVPRDNRNLSIREYFNFLNGNNGPYLRKNLEVLHADGYVIKVTTHIYRAVQSSEQAYVVWIFGQ